MSDDTLEREARSETVQSLSRGLAVIRAFERQSPEMTLAEVATRTNLSRAVARRFLHTLVQDGYAATDGKRFRLTPKILDLGYAFLTSQDIWDVAQPIMADVVRQTCESCSASMLEGTEIVYVARVAAGRIMQVGLSVGSRLPAYCSSMGRVLLAALPCHELDAYIARAEFRKLTARTLTDPAQLRRALADVRSEGFALVDGELEPGLRSLAVPIQRRSGAVVAAMNVSAQASSETVEAFQARCLPVLRDAAERICRGIPG